MAEEQLKASMVADEINHHQALFTRLEPETAAKLLEIDHGDSVGRIMRTVSIPGISTPSLNRSTQKIISKEPVLNRSRASCRRTLDLE